MMITKKTLPRRTVLRGLGASLSLPLLDGMVPALAATRNTAANPVRRFGAIYVPNGVEMRAWTPPGAAGPLELTPVLEPLAPVREQVNVLSGLADKVAIPREGEGVGDHARAASTWLTGVHVKKTEGPDIQAGTSMDQIAARAFGQETQLTSLELAIDSVEVLGACDQGYSCAYVNTIAWRTPTTPLPMENNPRAVFERLFGATDSTDVEARLARLRQDRSILDFVTGEADALRRALGAGDRLKLAQYLDAVRDVERRIQMAEEQSDREIPVVEQPVGIPDTFEEHCRLMFDLLLLAYQTDLTRVSTFMFGKEVSGRSFPEIGVPGGHHGYSHHQNIPENLEMLARINTHHIRQFGTSWRRCRRPRTATARCSTTRCSSTARASATATSTSTSTCRPCSRAARRGGSGAGATCAIRPTPPSPTCTSRSSTSWGCRWRPSATAPGRWGT